MSELPPVRPNSKLVLPPIKQNGKSKVETEERSDTSSGKNEHEAANGSPQNSQNYSEVDPKQDTLESDSNVISAFSPSPFNLRIETPDVKLEGSYHEEADIHETIPLTLTLPNGEILTRTIKIGDTVQAIKRTLLVEHSLPYEKIELCLDGKSMMDPLSLNDFPLIVERKAANLVAQFKGNLTQPIQMVSTPEDSQDKETPTLMNIPPPKEKGETMLHQAKPEKYEELEPEVPNKSKEGWTESTKSIEKEEKPNERATFQNNIAPTSVFQELPGISSQNHEAKKEKEQTKKLTCCTVM